MARGDDERLEQQLAEWAAQGNDRWLDDDSDDYMEGEPDPFASLNIDVVRRLVDDALRRWNVGVFEVSRMHEHHVRQLARMLAARQNTRTQTQLQRVAKPFSMTQTEVALRLAVHLLRESIVVDDVHVVLPRREVTGRGEPMFDVAQFVLRQGGNRVPAQKARYPYGRYRVAGASKDIVIDRDKGQCPVTSILGPESNLLGYVCGGPRRPTPGPYEHLLFRKGLGAALTSHDPQPLDIVLLALPRSPRMRKLVEHARSQPRLAATAISLVLVDSTGNVDGLPFPERYKPTVYDAD